MTVRRAIIGDEATLRALRLQALTNAPEAFGSTYERELARTPDDWRRWMSPGATFIYESADGAKGIVAAARDAADSSIVQLMAMWVDPDFRGSGAAEALVAAVVAWTKAEGAKTTRLAVIKTNERAQRFYERCGFVMTGREMLCERDARIELEMERPLTR